MESTTMRVSIDRLQMPTLASIAEHMRRYMSVSDRRTEKGRRTHDSTRTDGRQNHTFPSNFHGGAIQRWIEVMLRAFWYRGHACKVVALSRVEESQYVPHEMTRKP